MDSRSEPCLCGDPECTLCFPDYFQELPEYNKYDDEDRGVRDGNN